jgi:hypothetical protein
MASQVIQVGSAAAFSSGQRHRSRATVESRLSPALRTAVALVFLLLGICGMAAIGSDSAANALPPEGPTAGLGL